MDAESNNTTDTEPRRSLRTHAEALIGNHLGQPVPSCSGALVWWDAADDRVIRDGVQVHRTIHVYRCCACGTVVSIARDQFAGEDPFVPLSFDAESLDWELLNAYRPQTLPPADRLATELAHAFELPTNGSARNGQE